MIFKVDYTDDDGKQIAETFAAGPAAWARFHEMAALGRAVSLFRHEPEEWVELTHVNRQEKIRRMLPAYLHKATVRGLGPFPLDMLRHDCCWPATLADAALIAETIRARAPGPRVTIQLEARTGLTAQPWTRKRWDASCWELLAEPPLAESWR